MDVWEICGPCRLGPSDAWLMEVVRGIEVVEEVLSLIEAVEEEVLSLIEAVEEEGTWTWRYSLRGPPAGTADDVSQAGHMLTPSTGGTPRDCGVTSGGGADVSE